VDGHGLKDGFSSLVGRLLRTTLLLIFVGMHGDVVAVLVQSLDDDGWYFPRGFTQRGPDQGGQ
jgi:hypothetical protein